MTAAAADGAARRIEGPIPMTRIRFGENVERICQERGWSFDALAARSRIARGQIEEMVRGEREARTEDLVLLAGALDVTADDLIEGIVWILASEGGPRWEVTVGGRR